MLKLIKVFDCSMNNNEDDNDDNDDNVENDNEDTGCLKIDDEKDDKDICCLYE